MLERLHCGPGMELLTLKAASGHVFSAASLQTSQQHCQLQNKYPNACACGGFSKHPTPCSLCLLNVDAAWPFVPDENKDQRPPTVMTIKGRAVPCPHAAAEQGEAEKLSLVQQAHSGWAEPCWPNFPPSGAWLPPPHPCHLKKKC